MPQTNGNNNSFQSFTVINPDYLLVNNVRGTKDDNGNYNYHDDTDYKRYALIVINKRFTLYVDQQRDFHIVNYAGNFDLYIDGEYQKMQDSGSSQPSEKFTALIRRTYPIGEKFTEKGKTGLTADFSNTILIAPQYDSLFTEMGYFITAYKKKRPYLFYRNGKAVELKNLRAVYNGYNTAVLVDNHISWLSPDGVLTDRVEPQIVCGAYDIRPDSIQIQNGYFILKQYNTGEEFYRNYKDYNITEYNLAPVTAFKQIYFINGSTAANDISYRYLIAETHDGKKGIITPGLSNGAYTVPLAPDYQNFTYLYTDFVRIDNQNGLSGYFPLNKNAKYTALDTFNKGFARFTLPNGKQGWLSLDGKEYLDE